MTKKDYVLIAGRICEVLKHYDERAINNIVWEVIDSIADGLAQDNERFDRIRFEQYIKDQLGYIDDLHGLSEEAV